MIIIRLARNKKMKMQKKNIYNINVFLEFLHSENEATNIYKILPKELNNLAKKFVLSVRKRNSDRIQKSTNQSCSIRAFLQSIDRYHSKNGCCPLSLLNNREFSVAQNILKKKQKWLKSIGKGNKSNSAVLVLRRCFGK